jgi:hypothetical protein
MTVISFAYIFLTQVFAAELPRLELKGDIKSETAYRLSRPREFTKTRNQLTLSKNGRLSEKLSFKLKGRFYYDLVYNHTNNFPQNVASDQRKDFQLREAYLDYSNGPFDLRMGKQQIVWGEAVGIFFADVVNAKDLREFILPEFEWIRIPQWGVNFEYAKKNFHSEFIWLPVLEFNKLGVRGAEFEFPHPVPEGTSFTTQDPAEPKDSFKNSEAGLRLSYLIKGWDLSAFYFYSWDKFPARFRSISAGVYNFTPRYKRLNILGTTFSKEIKNVVLKGEFVFNRKGHFSIFDNTDADGITRKDFIDYLIGLDYTFPAGINTNVQFMQRIIFNYDKRLVNEKAVRNSVSFWVSKNFLNNNLKAECLVISSLMEKDLLYRPKVTYTFSSNWKWGAGIDIFHGERSGIFGKFRNKDRAYSEITYSF